MVPIDLTILNNEKLLCNNSIDHKIRQIAKKSSKIYKDLIGSCRARLDNRKCLLEPDVYITWHSKIQKCSYFLVLGLIPV